MLALFWVLWLERNAKIFEGKEIGLDAIWDRPYFLASFWTSNSRPFLGIPLFFIKSDWKAVCDS